MKRTVSSFTTEHLQQSLQRCNESISYDESTGYGGRLSATENGHLPHHRDRCGRWVSAHLPQERIDFQVYGIPLQMCMWFYMKILYFVIQRSFATKDLVCIHFIIHCFMFTRSFASLWMTNENINNNGYYGEWSEGLKHRIYMSWRTCKRVKGDSPTRQGAFMNSSKSFLETIKDFFKKFFISLKSSVKCLKNYFAK